MREGEAGRGEMTTGASTTTAFVYAVDPISRAGVAAELRSFPEVAVVTEDRLDPTTVVVAVTDRLSDDALQSIRRLRQAGSGHVLLVVSDLEEGELFKAVEAGVTAVVRRVDATPEVLIEAIRAVSAGNGSIPPDLLGRFLDDVGRLQQRVLGPRGLSPSGFTERELRVLRLVAEGL